MNVLGLVWGLVLVYLWFRQPLCFKWCGKEEEFVECASKVGSLISSK